MDTKDYLNTAYRLTRQIEMNKKRLIKAKEKAIDISAKICDERVQTSSANNSTMAIMTELATDLSTKISEQEIELNKLKSEIESAINTIDDSDIKIVLKLRYLCFLSWDEIMSQLFISRATVFRLHKVGVEKLRPRDTP